MKKEGIGMTDLLLLEEMTELNLEEEAEYLEEYYHPYDLGDVLDLEEIDLLEAKEAEEEAFITMMMDEQAEKYEREALAQIEGWIL